MTTFQQTELIMRWVGPERHLDNYGIPSSLVIDITGHVRQELRKKYPGYGFFENPGNHISVFQKLADEYYETGRVSRSSKKQCDSFLRRLSMTFEKDCQRIQRDKKIFAADKLVGANKYLLYQVCGEYEAFHDIKRELPPSWQNEINKQSELIRCMNATIKPTMRYPKQSDIVKFMTLLHQLHNLGLLEHKYASSAALLRSQLTSYFIDGRDVSYTAFNTLSGSFNLTCANCHGYEDDIKKKLAPTVYRHLKGHAESQKEPWGCVINIIDNDDANMQYIAACDVHRFLIAGLKPKPLFDSSISNKMTGFELEDTALKPLMNCAQLAGFKGFETNEKKEVVQFTRQNDGSYIYVPNYLN